MPRYMLDDRQAHHIYLLSSDIEEVKPTRDGVQIRVSWHKAYSKDERFRETWDGQSLTVDLEVSQALEAVQQDRDKDKAFCQDCFDWGKCSEIPKGCARCALLAALKKGKHGDFRQATSSLPRTTSGQRPGNGSTIAIILLVLAFWCVLCLWANAEVRVEQLEQKMERVKR